MDNREAVAVGVEPRTWSLRREWSRAFTVMLVILLVTTVSVLAGVRHLVGQFSAAAHQLDRQSSVVATLRAGLNDHEERGHALLDGTPENRAAFLAQQGQISAEFDRALRVFPEGAGTTSVLQHSETEWQSSLTRTGLWGAQVRTLDGTHPDLQTEFGTGSDRARALLDSLDQPPANGLHARLEHNEELERLLMLALAALAGLGISVTVYYRRRMIRDVVRPVAAMHKGVLKLQAGEYDHRIPIARRDELGDLAGAFNEMAEALRVNHDALTLRATRDSLTGLPNRAALLERLSAGLSAGNERRARQESVLFVDIDDFKDVNDSVGHEGGDALLLQLSARLSDCVRPHDLVARMGGDEFAIVVVEDEGGATAIDVAERILRVLQPPFQIGGTRLVVSVSIGIARTREGTTTDGGELLRRADFAMYMAKGAGKGCYRVFDGAANYLVGH